MKGIIDLDDISGFYGVDSASPECDGTCGCAVPCSTCRGHRRLESEREAPIEDSAPRVVLAD